MNMLRACGGCNTSCLNKEGEQLKREVCFPVNFGEEGFYDE